MRHAQGQGGTALAEEIDVSHIIDELQVAYRMEMETVMNYMANSINLEGIRAQEIKDSLAGDIKAELEHAEKLGQRIHVLNGLVPGSMALQFDQRSLQPGTDQTDVATVIRGVIAAEESAIEQYHKIIQMCEQFDYVTQELCIELLGDEEKHRREFEGFLKEYSP